MDEQKALQGLQTGNLSGLDSLLKRYQLKAIRAAFLVTQNTQAAEDIVQSAFIQLPERLRSYDGSRPFEPWFMRCVLNDAVKLVQRDTRWMSLDSATEEDNESPLLDFVTDSAASIEAQIEATDLEAFIQRGLLALPPHQRAVIVMRYYLDMSEQEIAEQVQAAPGTVKSRLNRAKKQLSGWLKTNTAAIE